MKGILLSIILPRLEHLPKAPELFRWYYTLINNTDLERENGGWIYKGIFYPDYLTMGGASHAIFTTANRFCKGYGIDVGAGFWPFPGSVAVDSYRGTGLVKAVTDFEDNTLDYIFSSHCLEHIESWEHALNKWVKKLRHDGVIFIYLPHPDCEIWHPGSPFVGDGHKWIPTPDIIKQKLIDNNCAIISFDDGPDAMQSFYVCGRKK